MRRPPGGERGLSVVLVILYVVIQIGQAVVGWVEYVAEQTSHGDDPMVFGDQGYVWTFLEQSLQNWQSEFLALATLVALSAVLIHRESKHSREGSDEIQQRVKDIQRRVDGVLAEQRS